MEIIAKPLKSLINETHSLSKDSKLAVDDDDADKMLRVHLSYVWATPCDATSVLCNRIMSDVCPIAL